MKVITILETLKNQYIGKIIEIFQEECFQVDSKQWKLLETACIESYNRESEIRDCCRAIIPIQGMVIDVQFYNNYGDSEYTIEIREVVERIEKVSRVFYCQLKFC